MSVLALIAAAACLLGAVLALRTARRTLSRARDLLVAANYTLDQVRIEEARLRRLARDHYARVAEHEEPAERRLP